MASRWRASASSPSLSRVTHSVALGGDLGHRVAFFGGKSGENRRIQTFKLQVNYVVSLILNLLACRMDGNGNCQHDTSWHEWRGVSTLAMIGCTSNIATHQHPDSTAIWLTVINSPWAIKGTTNGGPLWSMKPWDISILRAPNHSSFSSHQLLRQEIRPFLMPAKSASTLFPAVRRRRRTKMDKLTPAKFSS